MRLSLAGVSVVLAAIPVASLALASPVADRPLPPAMPADPVFQRTVLPFFAANCVSCHNSASPAAGLNLEALHTAGSVATNTQAWQDIDRKLRANLMPPAAMPRPDAAQQKAVMTWIESAIDLANSRIKPEAGRVTARRLNRAEYDNTVRDLLGVTFHPADDFPQDDSGYGFDNNGDVLTLSPLLMEQYMAAAEKVARVAVFGPDRIPPSLVKLDPAHEHARPDPHIPHVYDLTGLSLASSSHVTHRFPVEGDYEIGTELYGQRALGSEPIQIGLWLDGRLVRRVEYEPKYVATFDANPEDLNYQSAHFPRLHITAGDHWLAATILRMYEGLPRRFGGPNPSALPEPAPGPVQFPFPKRFLVPPPNATPEQIAAIEARKKSFLEQRAKEREELPSASRLGSFLITGPYNQVTGPSAASKALLYTCGHLDGHHRPGCARAILTSLARRAFRRPVAPRDVDRYVQLFQLAQSHGASFDEALSLAIQGVLVSPRFLFRIEDDRAAAPLPGGGSAHIINQYELASRLSYFLWSSMPDAELMKCADAGMLRNPNVLHHEVRRMLLDPKSRTLAENFAGQWLELRKLESIAPDQDMFPSFDEYLRISMRQETEMFFDNIVRHDGRVLDFIDGNYSFLNERLANFYGVPGVTGAGFRRVDLTGTERGGILTQASVLTVSSYATRTSPVLRGKWILENLLNTPPPPPPPNVPALEQTKIASGASLRQQLEQHRANPLCASCHAKMDPLGFALENFDAIGYWRTIDGKTPIDPSGRLPDGRTFRGPKELEHILIGDRAGFTRCLTDKMLTYALGRGLERYDEPTVTAISANVARDDYRFSSLVFGIVDSLPFQQRKGS